MLSQYAEEGYALDLVAEGPEGVGYLLKDRIAEIDRFVESVRRVAEGGSALDPEVVSLLVGRSRTEDPLAKLSAREREVLELMAEGRSNHSIAEHLEITERAVEKHITSIFAKLDLPAHGGRPPPGAGGAHVSARLTSVPGHLTTQWVVNRPEWQSWRAERTESGDPAAAVASGHHSQGDSAAARAWRADPRVSRRLSGRAWAPMSRPDTWLRSWQGEGSLARGSRPLTCWDGEAEPPGARGRDSSRLQDNGLKSRRCELRDRTIWKGIPVRAPRRHWWTSPRELSEEELARACHEAGVRHHTSPVR